MDERQSLQWQDLNSGYTIKRRAGHTYEARRRVPAGFWDTPHLAKTRLLVVTLIGVPSVLGLVCVLATGLWL
jgi:hypothetical protein